MFTIVVFLAGIMTAFFLTLILKFNTADMRFAMWLSVFAIALLTIL